MRTHSIDKKYKCDICGVVFEQKSNLIKHIKTHLDFKSNFRCRICKAKFLQKSTLMSHMKIHSIDNPFKCSICGTSYLLKTDLKKHEKSHMIDKALLICKLCNQSFPTKLKRINHERKFHTEEASQCLICYKLFFEKKELTHHIKLHMKIMSSECLKCKEPLLKVPVSAKVLRAITGNKKNVCDVCSVIF